jgi:hypothetical protein
MTPAQARMARALTKLALVKINNIGIGRNTISKFENAVTIPSKELQANLQRFYESKGCIFTENGVEPSKKRGND